MDCVMLHDRDGRYARVAVRTGEENQMLIRAVDAMTNVGGSGLDSSLKQRMGGGCHALWC